MRKTILCQLFFVFVCLLVVSCQKVSLEEINRTKVVENGIAVRFNVARLEQMPFDAMSSTRGTDVKGSCSRISLAIYQSGKKISQVNQESSDTNYGQFEVVLSPGSYRIVVIAHNGLKSPTMTDAEKITFDGKVTDTFYYCDDLTVSESVSHDLALKRAVAMFRLVVADKIPSNIAKMYFYYTGGSSTFDAVHGVGCVNSRQGELRDVTADMQEKGGIFEVYTFPRSDSNALSVTVSAMDAGNNAIMEKEFPVVDIKCNRITQYKGDFFGESSGGGETEPSAISIRLYSDDEWTLVEQTF